MDGVSIVQKLTVPPSVERNLTFVPSLFRGRVELLQKEAVTESLVENARFQRDAQGFSEMRHLPGCNDLRALTVGEKIADRMDFLDANRLRVDKGRNHGV